MSRRGLPSTSARWPAPFWPDQAQANRSLSDQVLDLSVILERTELDITCAPLDRTVMGGEQEQETPEETVGTSVGDNVVATMEKKKVDSEKDGGAEKKAESKTTGNGDEKKNEGGMAVKTSSDKNEGEITLRRSERLLQKKFQ